MRDTKIQKGNWKQVRAALERLQAAVSLMEASLNNKNSRLGYGRSETIIHVAADLHAVHIKACMQQGRK